jgi:hypothetical protein
MHNLEKKKELSDDPCDSEFVDEGSVLDPTNTQQFHAKNID